MGLRQGLGWGGEERRSFHFLERKAWVLPAAAPGTGLSASTGENALGIWPPGFQPQVCHRFMADLGAALLPSLGLSLLSDKDLKIKKSFAILPSFLTFQVGVSVSGLPHM